MSQKNKKVYKTLNYLEHFLMFISAASGCVSISAFSSLVDIPVGITSSALGLKISTINAGINKYKSIIKKKRKKLRINSVASKKLIKYNKF